MSRLMRRSIICEIQIERPPRGRNALVDEAINLAYHDARAEKQGFNITLERSFDPAAGDVDVFPQEITRVLLNLISNHTAEEHMRFRVGQLEARYARCDLTAV